MDRKWLRHYEPGVPRNLEYPLFPAYMILKNSAILSGERCALREYKTKYKYTFEELFKDSKKMANLLIKMGVKKGDRILLRVPNSNLFVAAFWGIIMSGGVVVALNTAYTEREVANIAEQVKPTYMITHDNFGEDVYETIKMDLIRYREVIKSFPITEPDVGINPEEDLAFIQYTGGTTGEPKGCAFTHENYVAAIYSKTAWTSNLSKYIDISERQMLCSLPLSHIFGLITLGQSALSLTTVVIMERFGLDEIMRAFVMDKFSTWPCVPTMLSLVLNHKFVKEKNMQITKRIKTITVGGAPCSYKLREQIKENFMNVYEGWAMTETCGCGTGPPLLGRHKEEYGLPCCGLDVKIVDADGEEVKTNELGELYVKAPFVMKYYWNNEEETKSAFDSGWFKTGDIACMDNDGYIKIIGRKKETIIHGGYTVYPQEVDNVVMAVGNEVFPFDILDVITYGVEDEIYGENIVVAIRIDKGYEDSDLDSYKNGLIEHCKKELASFKLPSKIIITDKPLARTPAGKPQRYKMKYLFE